MKGGVIWITGLSASGKSTLASGLNRHFSEIGKKTVLLDGDELRGIFNSSVDKSSYGRESRKELALKYSKLCQMLAQQECLVIIATISMINEVYEWNKKNITNYFEIFLDTDKSTLQERDPKKIYEAYRSGELKNVAGFDLLVDYPVSSDLIISIDSNSKKESVFNKAISSFKNIDWIG